jgi:hypothetical protein
MATLLMPASHGIWIAELGATACGLLGLWREVVLRRHLWQPAAAHTPPTIISCYHRERAARPARWPVVRPPWRTAASTPPRPPPTLRWIYARCALAELNRRGCGLGACLSEPPVAGHLGAAQDGAAGRDGQCLAWFVSASYPVYCRFRLPRVTAWCLVVVGGRWPPAFARRCSGMSCARWRRPRRSHGSPSCARCDSWVSTFNTGLLPKRASCTRASRV